MFKNLNSTSVQTPTVSYSEVRLTTLTGLFNNWLKHGNYATHYDWQSASVGTGPLILYRVIIVTYRKHHKQPRNTIRGQNSKVSKDKRGDTYSNGRTMKG
jgi:hypothetical protein